MKNYIGIQDDRHRLIDHDHRLNEKIADLQYIIQPQFICIDGIIAGEGRMLTPKPFDLKLIVMGNNQVAFDAVCCAIIGVDPNTVDHIRFAAERGFGTTDLSKIAISGDVTLEKAKERAKGFEVGLIRVEKYFEGRTSRRTPARRRRSSTPTTAGEAARAPSRRRSRSCARSTTSSTRTRRTCTSSSAPTTGRSTPSRARRSSSWATA